MRGFPQRISACGYLLILSGFCVLFAETPSNSSTVAEGPGSLYIKEILFSRVVDSSSKTIPVGHSTPPNGKVVGKKLYCWIKIAGDREALDDLQSTKQNSIRFEWIYKDGDDLKDVASVPVGRIDDPRLGIDVDEKKEFGYRTWANIDKSIPDDGWYCVRVKGPDGTLMRTADNQVEHWVYFASR